MPTTLPTAGNYTRSFNIAILVLRVVIGCIMMPHGAMKLFPGVRRPRDRSDLPTWRHPYSPHRDSRVVRGLGLALGFLTRFSAFWLAVTQIGAVVKVHWANGFFNGCPPGFEYNLSLIASFITMFIAGPGKFAIIRLYRYFIPALKKIIPFIE